MRGLAPGACRWRQVSVACSEQEPGGRALRRILLAAAAVWLSLVCAAVALAADRPAAAATTPIAGNRG
jgi:hypothetical protein